MKMRFSYIIGDFVIHFPELFRHTQALVSLDFDIPLLHRTTGTTMLFQDSRNILHGHRVMLHAGYDRYDFSFPAFRVERNTNGFPFAIVQMLSTRFGRRRFLPLRSRQKLSQVGERTELL